MQINTIAIIHNRTCFFRYGLSVILKWLPVWRICWHHCLHLGSFRCPWIKEQPEPKALVASSWFGISSTPLLANHLPPWRTSISLNIKGKEEFSLSQQSCEKEYPARTEQIQGTGRYKILKYFLIVCTSSDLTSTAYCGYPVKKKIRWSFFTTYLFLVPISFPRKEGG